MLLSSHRFWFSYHIIWIFQVQLWLGPKGSRIHEFRPFCHFHWAVASSIFFPASFLSENGRRSTKFSDRQIGSELYGFEMIALCEFVCTWTLHALVMIFMIIIDNWVTMKGYLLSNYNRPIAVLRRTKGNIGDLGGQESFFFCIFWIFRAPRSRAKCWKNFPIRIPGGNSVFKILIFFPLIVG